MRASSGCVQGRAAPRGARRGRCRVRGTGAQRRPPASPAHDPRPSPPAPAGPSQQHQIRGVGCGGSGVGLRVLPAWQLAGCRRAPPPAAHCPPARNLVNLWCTTGAKPVHNRCTTGTTHNQNRHKTVHNTLAGIVRVRGDYYTVFDNRRAARWARRAAAASLPRCSALGERPLPLLGCRRSAAAAQALPPCNAPPRRSMALGHMNDRFQFRDPDNVLIGPWEPESQARRAALAPAGPAAAGAGRGCGAGGHLGAAAGPPPALRASMQPTPLAAAV